MEIFLGSHHFLLIMKHTPPPLVFPASAVLSIRKTEKLSDGVAAVSGTEGVSHVSVKQRMLQSSQVKSSHLYLYSAFNNTNCDKATAQYQNGKIVSIM